MGRAIVMENDIQVLKIKVQELEDTVRGMVYTLNKLEETSVPLTVRGKRVKPEYVEPTKETKKESVNDKEKETNNEGDGESNKSSNKTSRKSKAKAK